MRVTVVGTGYVGLVTGTCLAETGNQVTCVDIDHVKVEDLKKGRLPIYEPDLEGIFRRNVQKKRLKFTRSLAEGMGQSEIVFLALPTPQSEDGSADLSYVLGVAEELGPLLKNYAVIVDKSTVPVGTAEKVRKVIAEKAKVSFDVVSNPEFLREGFAVSDFMKPDRVVIGTTSNKAKKLMLALYAPYTRQGNPIIFMDEKSAEMTKYAANSFLAMKISFMNEVANLAEKVGADVDAVRLGIGADERIGKRFLFAGIGYGGSCFPKDVQALAKTAKNNNYDFLLLNSVIKVNELQRLRFIEKILKFYNQDIKGKKFALWGLAFKPDTDDIREAPALTIIDNLTKFGAQITAYDPEAMANVAKYYGRANDIKFTKDAYEALGQADALIIATEWPEFRTPDFKRVKSMLKQPVIFDGRNLYDLNAIQNEGFHYESIGRKVLKIDKK